jgi:protein gp37
MGATSIEWTATVRPDGTTTPGFTFNPWRGCTKVSAGCKNCYAETLSGRNPKTLGVWGPGGTRVVAAESYWRQPLKWDAAAKAAGERHRVFCASLADVFEDWEGVVAQASGDTLYVYDEGFALLDGRNDIVWRAGGWSNNCNRYIPGRPLTMDDVRGRLFALIEQTPHLDWLLLTKRPENVLRMTHDAWCKPVPGHVSQNEGDGRHWHWPPNVWLGTSVEDQKAADERIPHLLSTPAAVRFLSAEPLLGPVDLSRWLDNPVVAGHPAWRNVPDRPSVADPMLHWVIVGGESGPGARGCDIEWVRGLVRQCKVAGVPVFVKQLGAKPYTSEVWPLIPGSDTTTNWGAATEAEKQDAVHTLGMMLENAGVAIRDRKGGDIGEFPDDLKVREFPGVGR